PKPRRPPERARRRRVSEELLAIGLRGDAAHELVVEDGELVAVAHDEVDLPFDEEPGPTLLADREGEGQLARDGAGRALGERAAERSAEEGRDLAADPGDLRGVGVVAGLGGEGAERRRMRGGEIDALEEPVGEGPALGGVEAGRVEDEILVRTDDLGGIVD